MSYTFEIFICIGPGCASQGQLYVDGCGPRFSTSIISQLVQKGQGWNLRSRSLQPMVAIALSVEIQRQEATLLNTSIFLSVSADHVAPPPDP